MSSVVNPWFPERFEGSNAEADKTTGFSNHIKWKRDEGIGSFVFGLYGRAD